MDFTLRSRRSLKPFAMFALALGVMTFATVGTPATAPASAATRADKIAALAQANVGRGAGWCSDVNSSNNSLNGTSFGTSCKPESWCADFVKWVWENSGVNVVGLDARAVSFITAAGTNGSTVHKESSYDPQVGDAVVFDLVGVSSASHVGIVVQRNSDGSLVVANGNFQGHGDPLMSRVTKDTINAGNAHVGGYQYTQRISAFVTPGGLEASGGSTGATDASWAVVALPDAVDYVSSGNFAISKKPGVRYAFWRGADGSLQQGTWGGQSWSLAPLPDISAGSADYPNLSTAVNSSGDTSVAWRSNTSTIGVAYYSQSWQTATVPTDGHSVDSDVALVERSGKRDVFWRGENDQLYQATQNVSTKAWSAVQEPAVILGTDDDKYVDASLSAVANSNGYTAVSWKRSATSFGFAYWNGTKWVTETVQTGGGDAAMKSNIAMDDRSGMRDVFWRGADGFLYQATWNGSTWGVGVLPVYLGTDAGLQLSASTSSTGATSVSWNQSDGTMGIAYWNGSQWVTEK